MPSLGGEVKYVSHVPALRHVKEPSNFVNYGLLATFPGLSSVLRKQRSLTLLGVQRLWR
jgi:hypothetical protein